MNDINLCVKRHDSQPQRKSGSMSRACVKVNGDGGGNDLVRMYAAIQNGGTKGIVTSN